MSKLPPWAQVCILVAGLAAPIVAYKLLGSVEAMAAVGSFSTLINYFLGRGEAAAPPPAGPPSMGFKVDP